MTADFAGQRVDLALEADFRLGGIEVRPSTRQVESGGAAETLEPRIMQVLVALARKRGQVVSRDELIETCWEGRIVGDDALNRCTSRIRKLGEAKGDFRLETIPRVGYRLQETPQPGQPEKAAAADPAPAPIPPWLRRFLVPRAIVLAAVVVLVLAGWSLWGRGARAAALEPSIAVLPFANLTGDDEKDYLGRGIAMEIIDTLSQLDGVKVIARNSSFTFDPDADPRAVGQDLKVAHVLSGTVSEESGRIRITADLADVKTGVAIWSRPFVRDLAPQDPYAVQRLIAEQVSGAMSIAFDVDAREHLAGSGTRNLEAYDFYLRGFDEWWYTGDRERSIESFARAVELDPNYADAWAGRAIAVASTWGLLPPDEARVQEDIAYTMAQRAAKLDPNLSFAQAILGAVSTTQGKWKDAEKATLRALEISRTSMALNNRQMLLLRTGRISEAYPMLQELRLSDPLGGDDNLAIVNLLPAMGRQAELQEIMTSHGWSDSESLAQLQFMLIGLINSKAPDASIRQALERISQRPEEAPAKFARAILAVFDKPEKAREALRLWYEDKSFRHFVKWNLIPFLAAWYGDTDLVLRAWKDELPGHPVRTIYIWGPPFAEARARPEFKALVEEIGFVDYWREYGWADKCRPLGDADFECV